MTWSQISLVQKKGKKKERKATGGETNRKNLDVLIPLNLIHLHLKLCLPYFDGWIICFAYGKFFWVNFEFRSPLPQDTWSWNYSLIFFSALSLVSLTCRRFGPAQMHIRHLVHAKRSLIFDHIWSLWKHSWRPLVYFKGSLIFGPFRTICHGPSMLNDILDRTAS